MVPESFLCNCLQVSVDVKVHQNKSLNYKEAKSGYGGTHPCSHPSLKRQSQSSSHPLGMTPLLPSKSETRCPTVGPSALLATMSTL